MDGEGCSRATRWGTKGYGRRSRVRPWLPLAPLQPLMRSRKTAVADAPSPVPLRNQSPRGANSAWSARTALLPQTHHPNTQRGGSPPWSPGMSTGTPTTPHLGTAMAQGPPNCPCACTRPCVCSTQHGRTRAPGCRVRLRAQPPVCHAHPCVPLPRSRVCIRRQGGPGRRPGGLPGTSSLCAWCPGGGKVLEDAHGWRGQRKQSRVPAQLQPAQLTLPSWLIVHALALLRELGGFGVSGGSPAPLPRAAPRRHLPPPRCRCDTAATCMCRC